MKILNFDGFVSAINEAHAIKLNKMEVLVASILNSYKETDKFSVTAFTTLIDFVNPMLKKKDLKADIIPAVATRLGMSVNELTTLMKLVKKKQDQFSSDMLQQTVKSHMGYVSGARMSVDATVRDLNKYFKSLDATPSTENLQEPFKNSFTLNPKKTNVNSREYSLFEYLNSKKNKEDDVLENIKQLKFGEDATREMIQHGLNNTDVIDLTKYDTILAPKSSSKILPLFIEEVIEFIKQNPKAKVPTVTKNAFFKIPGTDVIWDMKKIDELTDEVTKAKVMETIKRTQKPEGLSLSKDVYIRFRKYLLEFMNFTPEGKSAASAGQNILLIDDFVTGGTTIKEMERLVKSVSNTKPFTLTILRVVNS